MSDEFGEEYHRKALYRERPNSPRNRRRLAEVKRLRPHGGLLLEVGCAEGGFLRLAADHYEVLGIDASEYAVRALRERLGLPAEVLDIEKDGLPPGPFDLIAAFNVFEHLADPSAALARLFRVLGNGGLLIGSVPNNGGIVGRPASMIGNRLDRSHRSVYSPAGWRRVFETSGFASVRFFGELNFGRNRSVYIRRPLWRHVSFALVFVCEKC